MFRGHQPFSEPETSNIAKFIEQNKDQIKSYITFHTYGSYWFHGYANVNNSVPEDVEDLVIKNKTKQTLPENALCNITSENFSESSY